LNRSSGTIDGIASHGIASVLAILGFATLASAQVYDANIVVNSGFENGPASPNGQTVVPPTGWTSIGSATVVPYSIGGQFPTASSPGSPIRGNQFLAGGPTSSLGQVFQLVDLTAYGSAIDSGGVAFQFGAWLGGFGAEDDIARAIIVWADVNSNSLRTDTIVGPSAVVRGGVTGFENYFTSSRVPVGVRKALITVTLSRIIQPYNNAYIDDVSLELRRVCDEIDFNNDLSVFDPVDIDAFLSVFSEGPCVPVESACNDIDFNNDGSVFDPADIESFLSVFSEGPCLPQ